MNIPRVLARHPLCGHFCAAFTDITVVEGGCPVHDPEVRLPIPHGHYRYQDGALEFVLVWN